jgi:hypothetical protein
MIFAKTIPRPPGADACDVCHAARAICDAPTRPGPWGYLCLDCFTRIGVPGIGFLFADAKLPDVKP